MKKNKLLAYLLFVCFACTPRESQENNKKMVQENNIKTQETIGVKLFLNNCASCHLVSNQNLIGPGMAGLTKRRKKEWTLSFIKNSQALIASGDKEAKEVYEKYNKTLMTSFPFSDVEMEELYKYLETL